VLLQILALLLVRDGVCRADAVGISSNAVVVEQESDEHCYQSTYTYTVMINITLQLTFSLL
jgi:hypothetical protein